jgi:polyhydroxyalkanoate synthase subunit PhaC
MISPLAPTPRDPVLRDGTAHLYRFRPNEDAGRRVGGERLPLLLVPSLINRWYILDLREGVSLARAMVDAGLDTWCLDWGVPEDEDRFLTWDDVVARLARAIRAVRRETGAEQVGLLGYCMGGTLAAIQTALAPDHIAALVNLAGPIDFSQGGALTTQTDPRWFDAQAIADAGNVQPSMMQSGFVALRPTLQISKWISYMDRAHDPAFRTAFESLEAWSGDNVAFPGAAYSTYIGDLYQGNALVKGTHRVAGKRVDLAAIDCPVLTVVTDRDTICPPLAAQALNELTSSKDAEVFVVPGGHVGAVVGNKAPTVLYPKLASWLTTRLSR